MRGVIPPHCLCMRRADDGTVVLMASDEWPESIRDMVDRLPPYVEMMDIGDIFGFSAAHVRRMRMEHPGTGITIAHLPEPSDDFRQRRPLLWRVETIIEWGLFTGRIDPITGERRSLGSRGRPITTPLPTRT